jgi:DNA-binding transcriptional LysR family regulator
MNLQTRLVFHEVARHRSFAAAALALPRQITEAAVRKQIRLLEQELHTTLLLRDPVSLTPQGRALYEHNHPLIEKLLHDAQHLRHRSGPRLRPGVTGSAIKLFLVPPVESWLSQPTRMPIDCRFGSFRELRPALEAGDLDLLVTPLDGPVPTGFASHTLAVFPQVLIVPPDCPYVSAAELWTGGKIGRQLIAPGKEDPVTLAFDRGLARGGLTWSARLTCDNPATVLQLVLAGLGYGLSLAAAPCRDPRAEDRGQKTEVRDQGAASGCPSPRSGNPTSVLERSALGVGRSAFAASAAVRGIRELPLAGFDPIPIVALWRPEDSTRLKEPLRCLRGIG